jgi:hypothetical protein
MTDEPSRRRSHSRPWRAVISTVALCVLTAACSQAAAHPGRQRTTTTGSGAPTSTSVSELGAITRGFASSVARRDRSGTVWLCRPELKGDPCAGDLAVTEVGPSGRADGVLAGTTGAAPAAMKKADCFYVYPTVSPQTGENASLAVEGSELEVARLQAAQFSRDCNVWAPMYRQVTLHGLTNLADAKSGTAIAFSSVLAGFEDYLHHFNDGRPIVLIGHSQGASMGIKLLEATMDRSAGLRRLLVSAVLLGGNVTVRSGSDLGGSFRHIPTCRSATETGCVIAYSSFLDAPPADTFFGKPGQGVSFLSGETASAGLQVVCTNPAALGGGTGALLPIFQAGNGISTPYVEYPGLYTARCEHRANTTWLQVDVVAKADDHRPTVSQDLGPNWGLHIVDVNVSLQNLIGVVAEQIRSYDGS